MSERAGRRGWTLALGLLVLVGLVGTSVALWIAAGDRRSANVAGFARAPVGCDTTLDFESSGTFVLYIETSGELGELAGACEVQPEYDRAADDIPRVELSLRDPDGDVVELTEATDLSYDVDGFVGSSVHRVEIDAPGDHVLTVAPTGGDPFAIAVGRTPDQGVALLRWGAVAAAIVGLVVGGLLLVLGSRRPRQPAAATPPWTPDGRGWPASPPGFPVPPPTTGATGPAGPPLTAPAPPLRPSPPASGDGARSPSAPPFGSPPGSPPGSPAPPPSPSPWGPPPSSQ
jgi:hypothetical protein